MDEDYIEETNINGVYVVKRPVIGDERGFFRETFRKKELDNRLGYEFNPVQANHSRSEKGVLRGIHVAPWNKLVTVARGKVQQVVVDLRKESPEFGKYFSIILGEENFVSVYIPANLGNAFLVLSEVADYNYLTTDYWSPLKELAVIFNDPQLNIKWELDNPILSDKDLQNPTLKEFFK